MSCQIRIILMLTKVYVTTGRQAHSEQHRLFGNSIIEYAFSKIYFYYSDNYTWKLILAW